MASRIKRVKPAPHHPDGWNTPVLPKPQDASEAPPVIEPSFEDVLYQILREAFGRSDAAARAVARLDYQLAVQQMAAASEDNTEDKPEAKFEDKFEDKIEPASPDGSTALIRGSSQEFDDREFVDTFERLSFLRMAIDLIEVLKLQDVRPELLQAMIDERFRPKVSQNRAAPETSTVAGSDMSVLLHNIKRAAERRSRTEPRSARAAK
jgi:hypothetical protein